MHVKNVFIHIKVLCSVFKSEFILTVSIIRYVNVC